MLLTSPEAFEVYSTELTDDVHWRFVVVVLHTSVEPRQHCFNLVLSEMLPIFAVNITFLAVVVLWFIQLVTFHFFFRFEILCAVRIRALRVELVTAHILGHVGCVEKRIQV